MTQDAPSARITRCPTCGKSSRYDATNPVRPFCSARCKTSDIAQWADEAYRIPVSKQDPDQDELPDEDREEN